VNMKLRSGVKYNSEDRINLTADTLAQLNPNQLKQLEKIRRRGER